MSYRMGRSAHLSALLALGFVLSGCISGNGGGGSDPDGGGRPDSGLRADGGQLRLDFGESDAAVTEDAALPDATPDACVANGDEVCNGLDDDCDGTTDEGFDVGGACTEGQGVCAREGTRVCAEGVAVCDVEAGAPEGDERCDGRDNNCDGTVDEGFDVGVACRYDEGMCTSRGEMVCTGDGLATECDAAPIEIVAERCDDLDNDCDGEIDEGIEIGALCEAGVGQCRRGGFVECADDGEVICTARAGMPREEICDGFDNDCDGFADEDFGAEVCAAGEGACRVEGQTLCSPDGEFVCNAVPNEPVVEVCNGIDDDCDGSVDEDFGGALGEACMNALGACGRAGVFVCNDAGDEVFCDAPEPAGEPAVEACNGIDDDCDGVVDDDIPGVGEVCDGAELELCQVGLTGCADNGEIVCQATNIDPGREFCNQIDDDCDGTVDEDFAELGEGCEAGVGACYREGTFVCSGNGIGGGMDFEGIRQNVAHAELEAGGFEPCWAGRFNASEPIAGILEACNEEVLLMGCRPVGADALTIAAMGQRAQVITPTNGNVVNDHNGVGWYYSEARSWGFAPMGQPVSLNSCDTNNVQPELRMCMHTSNGNVTSGYRCGQTTVNGNANWERVLYHRPDGPGMVCSVAPGEPVAEVCNGIDDNCDGTVDEGAEGVGEVCQEGVGLCQRGETQCNEAGEIICQAFDIEASPEVCNGIDDDCNGELDDVAGLGEACDVGEGVCVAPGVLACADVAGVQLQEGVQFDVDPTELERMGFRRCYQATYNQSTPLAGVLDGCPGEVMLLGCRNVGEANLRVAAMGMRDEVLTDTGRVAAAVNEHNGVAWYFSDNYSMGFAPAGAAVNRSSCDTAGRDEEGRICWHTGNAQISSGYRCGSSTGAGAQHERVIWVADQLGGGLVCAGEPGEPAGAEVCNGLDDDCNGEVDEGFGLNAACEAGVGECRRDGVTVCDAAGEVVCGAVPGEPAEDVCNGLDEDCDGQADEGLDCPFFVSCQAALDAGNRLSGLYPLLVDGVPQNFWCDMETDGGGWTLVASTAGTTLDDYGVGYYADLATLAPANSNPAIFNGLDLGRVSDIRFACRDGRQAADAAMTVDLSFYANEWYSEFAAAGNDAASCFNEGGRPGELAPARRNNLTGDQLARNDQWNAGALEGEDACGDTGDFTVDFDDRGMDSNQSDGTDWGEDDSARKCGRSGLADGQWFIFVRPSQGFIDVEGAVTVIGNEALAAHYRRGQVPVTSYDYANLPEAPELGDLVIWLAPTDEAHWPAARALLPLMDAHSRSGGHVVADRGLSGLFVRQFDPGFVFADALGAPAGWFNGLAAAGGVRAPGGVGVDPRGDGAPLFAGLEPPLQHSGTDAFVRIEAEEGRAFSLEALAAFPGDGGAAFPDRSHNAIHRGRRCDGNVLLVGFDFADGLADENPAAAQRFANNLLVMAAGEAPAALNDVCPPRGEVRPNILVCGAAMSLLHELAPEGSGMNVGAGCVPDADTQALLLAGNPDFDGAAVAAYVAAGGIVITSKGSSAAVFNAVFGAEVAQGAERGLVNGACARTIAPALQLSVDDAFWRRNAFEAGEQCGFDLFGWPEITPLGGWADRTVSLAYRDVVDGGRVWLVEADWAPAAALDAQSAGYLRHMIGNGASNGLHFPGIRQNVPVAELEEGGFEQCFAGDYNDRGAAVAGILDACDGDVLLIGCRPTGADALTLGAMGARAEVLTDLGNERAAVHNHNGVDWYFSDSYSWGFVGEGTGVTRNSCDTANVQPELRMCWHTSNAAMSSGYRCGATFPRAGAYEKVIYHRAGPLQ
jgi:hypothetical protein